jgi:hypothetical protein
MEDGGTGRASTSRYGISSRDSGAQNRLGPGLKRNFSNPEPRKTEFHRWK